MKLCLIKRYTFCKQKPGSGLVQTFKTKEIAQILEISEGTVRVRLSRAREMMRQQYRDGEAEAAAESSFERENCRRTRKDASDFIRKPDFGEKQRTQTVKKGDIYGQI